MMYFLGILAPSLQLLGGELGKFVRANERQAESTNFQRMRQRASFVGGAVKFEAWRVTYVNDCKS